MDVTSQTFEMRGNVISSIYDTEDTSNRVTNISWSETATSTTEKVKLQIRTSPDGITWSNWCGESIVCDGNDYFTVSHGVAGGIASNHPLRTGGNDRYFQYKVSLFSDGAHTPVLYNTVSITYDFNSAPQFSDVSIGTLLGTYTVGSSPNSAVFDPSTNSIWTANRNSNNVTKLSASDGSLIGTYSVGSQPEGIVFDPSTNSIWTANNGSNTVTKLSTTDGSLVGTYPVSDYPYAITYDSFTHSIWALSSNSTTTVSKLLATDGSLVGSYVIPGQWGGSIAFDSYTNSLWVSVWSSNSTNNIIKVSALDGSVLGVYSAWRDPYIIAFDQVTNSIWTTTQGTGDITKISVVDGSIIGTYPVDWWPYSIVFDSSANSIWVANSSSNTVNRLSVIDGSLLGSFPLPINPITIIYDNSTHSIWVTAEGGTTISKFSASEHVTTSASQIATSTDSNYHKVQISYGIRDTDTTSGTVIPSFEYSLGGEWLPITTDLSTGALDPKFVATSTYTTYTALWDVMTAVPNISTTTVRIRVTINDGELAHNLATSTSAMFTIDTMPAVTVLSVSPVATPTQTTAPAYQYSGGGGFFSGGSLLSYFPSPSLTVVAPNITSNNSQNNVIPQNTNEIKQNSANSNQAVNSLAPSIQSLITKTIKFGSSNSEVINLQKFLAKDKTIYSEGNISGYFGPATQKAVKTFQVKYKISKQGQPGYGQVGPLTRQKINSLLSSQNGLVN